MLLLCEDVGKGCGLGLIVFEFASCFESLLNLSRITWQKKWVLWLYYEGLSTLFGASVFL